MRAVSTALSRFTKEKFRRRFKPKQMMAARVYGVKGPEDLEYLWANFQNLKAYFSQAAKNHNGMLGYLD
jgi:Domain of unknown function (DUF1877)